MSKPSTALPTGRYGATCGACETDGKPSRVNCTIDENGVMSAACENHGNMWNLATIEVFADLRKMHDERFMPGTLQERAGRWLVRCVGPDRSKDVDERNERFLEEAIELVQAGGMTADRAHALVDYVYGRPVGQVAQEVGGTLLTFFALCNAHGLNAEEEAERDLNRVYEIIPELREKNANKSDAITRAQKARNVFTPDGETRIAGAHETGTCHTTEGRRPYGACPAPVVERPARSLSLRFTHDNCGDRWFSRMVRAAAEQYFAADPNGVRHDFMASNGVHVGVFVHEHLGELPDDTQARRHHESMRRMRADLLLLTNPCLIVSYGGAKLVSAYYCTTHRDIARALALAVFGTPSPKSAAERYDLDVYVSKFFDAESWSEGQWEGVEFEVGGIAAYRLDALDRGEANDSSRG